MIDAEFLGEANLTRKLLEARARAEEAMQRRLEALAAEMVAEMQALAPEASGGLRESIRYEADQTEDGPGVMIRAGGTPETERPSASGHVFDNAVLQEYGTAHMPAQPFFNPTVDAFRSRIAEEAGAEAASAVVEIIESE
ncbi:HK97-gp10 family putative phage morphogenesis protein [uncultured Bosea sp.]|uniref:HK97-gp10 family putative phage morphogenesis protein n=1 Tax=uncultured Bosea sp. TaxID=211457 RepID=UPI00263AB0EA|nr:HK97-gp10 family putative phage morphogenesis protein [uncultured Bosea sp.]